MYEILIANLVVGGITVTLAILLVIADRYLNDYGVRKIAVNDDKMLEVSGGATLLSTLMKQEIFIPSACGGRGSCGLCKIKILEGGGQVLPTELPHLSKEELAGNIRLACQCKVRKDLRLEIPKHLLSVREFRGKVVSIRNLTGDIKELRIQLPKSLEYRPGQFIQFFVPSYDGVEGDVYRAYSMSSVPSLEKDRAHIELMIRLVKNGICTTYVHNKLKIGDEVTINGPYGEFYLRPTDAEMICIAGGSGMAPIKSIISDMVQRGINRKCTFFFGATNQENLFLVDEWREIEKLMPNFKFVPALSNEPDNSNWKGERGLITNIVDKFVQDGVNKEAYLCGSPGMLDACIKILKAKGIPEDKIYFDKF